MHIPVLQKEVIQYLNPQPNENFIDATIGGGGHTGEILQKIAPRGKVLGIDWTQEVIREIKKNPNLILVCDNFAHLAEIVGRHKFNKVSGILFDFGLSSWHLEESGRGFSFQKKEPLDMRYSLQNQLTAEKIVNFWSKFEIERILREYGEEKLARKIAEKIIGARKQKSIQNTAHLAEIIRQAGAAPRLTFQALRIAVNDELNNIKKVLPQALQILEPQGRLVVISFHSLEDRIVKEFFKNNILKINLLTRKPVIPFRQEVVVNSRSRSAKLRAAIKI